MKATGSIERILADKPQLKRQIGELGQKMNDHGVELAGSTALGDVRSPSQSNKRLPRNEPTSGMVR